MSLMTCHTEATAVPPLLPISNRTFLRLFLMQLKFIHDPVLLPFRCDSLLSRVSLISNHFSVCVCVVGGAGVVPDSRVEARAPAAAAANHPAGKHGRQSAAGQVHQHHAGHRHRHPGVRVHCGQVHRPAAAQSPPLGAHLRGRVPASAAVEELGTFAVRFGTFAPPALRPVWGGNQHVALHEPMILGSTVTRFKALSLTKNT